MVEKHRRLRLVLGLSACLLTSATVLAVRQIQTIPHPDLPRGTGAITGLVLGEKDRPLAGAKVVINAHGHYTPNFPSPYFSERTTTSDARGQFTFGELPGVPLELSASLAGYAAGVYGQSGPGLEGTPIQLNEGQNLTAVIRLSRGASVSGRMFDAKGIPAAGLQVYAFGLVPIAEGEMLMGQGGEAVTDERGDFRIGDLRPGRFIVSGHRIWPKHERSPLQRAGDGENSWVIESGAIYANATNYESAEQIVLTAGEARTGIDLRLRLDPATTIAGSVLNEDGTPEAGARVLMFPHKGDPLSISESTTRLDGTFQLGRVMPGEYDIKAYSRPGVPRWGHATVRSDGRQTGRVSIDLKPGATVTGRVIYSGRSAPVMPRPATLFFSSRFGPSRHDTHGVESQVASPDFTYRGVPPGQYTIFVNQESLPAGWYAQSELVDGIDAFDFPFEIRGAETRNVLITVSNEVTEISGMVSGPDGRPRSEHTVVAFAMDESYWGPASRRIEALRPDTNGRYRMRGLPPGEYAVALAGPDVLGRPSSTLLRSLRSSAARITLQSGAKATTNLVTR